MFCRTRDIGIHFGKATYFHVQQYVTKEIWVLLPLFNKKLLPRFWRSTVWKSWCKKIHLWRFKNVFKFYLRQFGIGSYGSAVCWNRWNSHTYTPCEWISLIIVGFIFENWYMFAASSLNLENVDRWVRHKWKS